MAATTDVRVDTQPTSQRWMLFAIIVVAFNLRPAVVAVAPVLDAIRADTGMSAAVAGLLTTLPVLCFGLFAAVAPWLAHRFRLEVAVAGALVLLAVGTVLRLPSPMGLLFAGTALAGASIAVVNTLIPALIKRDSATPGATTGIFAGSINLGAAASSGLIVPIMHALGVSWQTALALWAIPVAAGLAVWLPMLRHHSRRPVGDGDRINGLALLRDPLARRVVLFMGLQSLEFYAFAAWFPTLLHSHGISEETGGVMLATTNVFGAGAAVGLQTLARRFTSQRPLVVIVAAGYLIGLTGLLLAPAAGAWAWSVLFGLSQGAGFALALTLIVYRSPDHHVAAALSGTAQLVGYLIAAAGPITLGAVHDATGGWTVPVILLLAIIVPMLWSGLGAGRNAHVRRPHSAAT